MPFIKTKNLAVRYDIKPGLSAEVALKSGSYLLDFTFLPVQLRISKRDSSTDILTPENSEFSKHLDKLSKEIESYSDKNLRQIFVLLQYLNDPDVRESLDFEPLSFFSSINNYANFHNLSNPKPVSFNGLLENLASPNRKLFIYGTAHNKFWDILSLIHILPIISSKCGFNSIFIEGFPEYITVSGRQVRANTILKSFGAELSALRIEELQRAAFRKFCLQYPELTAARAYGNTPAENWLLSALHRELLFAALKLQLEIICLTNDQQNTPKKQTPESLENSIRTETIRFNKKIAKTLGKNNTDYKTIILIGTGHIEKEPWLSIDHKYSLPTLLKPFAPTTLLCVEQQTTAQAWKELPKEEYFVRLYHMLLELDHNIFRLYRLIKSRNI